MKRILSWMAAGVVAACGTEPGILLITVNNLPDFSSTATITVSGTVTRDPPADTPVVLAIAGGVSTVSDTLAGTSFSFNVQLNLNQENQLVLTASDGTGSVSQPTIIVIRHDDEGPQVLSSTPSHEQMDVALNTPIELRFGEPLVQSGPSASFTLRQNSRAVPGTPALSTDNTFFTFVPDAPLEPHSIYEMDLAGFTDDVGNPAIDGNTVCFITTSSGISTIGTTDTSSTFFIGGQDPVVLTAPDIIGATLARSGSTLYGLFEFAQARTLDGPANKASIFMDIDIDGDAGTGFQTFKDFQFDSIFPELATNMGAEMFVSMDVDIIADSGFIGVNTDDVTWDPIDVFIPGVCGRFFGFHTTAILGDSVMDDGFFNYAYTAFAIEDVNEEMSAVFADPVPEAGHFAADLITPGPALTAVETPRQPVDTFFDRHIRSPAIRMLRRLRGR